VSVLGGLGNSYEMLQNVKAFRFFDPIIDRKGSRVERLFSPVIKIRTGLELRETSPRHAEARFQFLSHVVGHYGKSWGFSSCVLREKPYNRVPIVIEV